VHLALAMWHVVTQYRGDMRQAVVVARLGRRRRTLRRALRWWAALIAYRHALDRSSWRVAARKMGRVLRAWSAQAAARGADTRQQLLATAAYVRGLMAAALAHWRTLALMRTCKRTWLQVRILRSPATMEVGRPLIRLWRSTPLPFPRVMQWMKWICLHDRRESAPGTASGCVASPLAPGTLWRGGLLQSSLRQRSSAGQAQVWRSSVCHRSERVIWHAC
jgi:hypothetical protein